MELITFELKIPSSPLEKVEDTYITPKQYFAGKPQDYIFVDHLNCQVIVIPKWDN